MRSPRFVELAVLVGLVALAASYFVRTEQQPAVRNVSPRGEFRWSETRSDDTYYFQLRSGGSWIAVLCSNSGPMPGNFVSEGRIETEESEAFFSGLEANGVLVVPDRGDGMPISFLFERGEETRRVAITEDDITGGLAEVLAIGPLGREREILLARKRRGEVPDYGFAVLPDNWPSAALKGRPLYWEYDVFLESTPKYAELTRKENLVLFFQNITTNGGHRTDFSVYRSEDGGLSYEASTPELLPRLEARGEVSSEDYQALREVFENLDGSRIETSFGHDCTYYAIYQREGEHPHRYYQWYGCGPMSIESDLVSGMLERVYRSTLYQEALSELARIDTVSPTR